MSDLKFLSDCKDEELIELRERNARLLANLEWARTHSADLMKQSARLVAVLRRIDHLIMEDVYILRNSALHKDIRNALQQSTEKP